MLGIFEWDISESSEQPLGLDKKVEETDLLCLDIHYELFALTSIMSCVDALNE